jgi:Flp pilus assembly protein TadD
VSLAFTEYFNLSVYADGLCSTPPTERLTAMTISTARNKHRLFTSAIAPICLLAALAGCSREQDDAQAFARGQAAMAKGDYHVARVELMSAARVHPNDPAVAKALARTLLELGDWLGARAAVADARRLGSTDPQLAVLEGEAAVLAGDEETLRLLLPRLAATPADKARLAAALTMMGDDKAAGVAAYRTAAAGFPSDGRLHIETGLAELSVGDINAAAGHASRALALEPKLPGSHILAGRVAEAQGRREAALTAYDRAVQVSPSNVAANLGRAAALGDLQRFDEMEEVLDRVDVLQAGNPIAAYMRAKLLATQNKTGEALSLLNATGQKLDNHLPALVLSAQLADREGFASLAISRMRRAVSMAPNELHLSYLLAEMLAREGQRDAALTALNAFDHLPEQPVEVAALRRQLAAR